MFTQAKIYILGVVVLAFIGLAGTTYIYKLKFDKAEIQRDAAVEQVRTALLINERIIAAQVEDDKLRNKLFADFKGARDDAEKFKVKLASHDLSSLAKAKPGLITIYARRATDRVLRDIEAAANGTGPTMPVSPVSGHDTPPTPSADSGSD